MNDAILLIAKLLKIALVNPDNIITHGMINLRVDSLFFYCEIYYNQKFMEF